MSVTKRWTYWLLLVTFVKQLSSECLKARYLVITMFARAWTPYHCVVWDNFHVVAAKK